MSFRAPTADAATIYDPVMKREGRIVKRGATYAWLIDESGTRWRVALTPWGAPVGGEVNPTLIELARRAGRIA